jgi:hypothetical protein
MTTRSQNERRFTHWQPLPNGGRLYWTDVSGKGGWRARYLKQVDSNECTVCFWQEIFDDKGTLVEIHRKYPEDLGHERLNKGES